MGHTLRMLIACVLPLLAIFLLPLFGISEDVSWFQAQGSHIRLVAGGGLDALGALFVFAPGQLGKPFLFENLSHGDGASGNAFLFQGLADIIRGHADWFCLRSRTICCRTASHDLAPGRAGSAKNWRVGSCRNWWVNCRKLPTV